MILQMDEQHSVVTDMVPLMTTATNIQYVLLTVGQALGSQMTPMKELAMVGQWVQPKGNFFFKKKKGKKMVGLFGQPMKTKGRQKVWRPWSKRKWLAFWPTMALTRRGKRDNLDVNQI